MHTSYVGYPTIGSQGVLRPLAQIYVVQLLGCQRRGFCGADHVLDSSESLTGWSFCTKASERVYITAEGCEIEFGATRGL